MNFRSQGEFVRNGKTTTEAEVTLRGLGNLPLAPSFVFNVFEGWVS